MSRIASMVRADSSDGYEGFQVDPGKVIWSVGVTPEDAIAALCLERWGGRLERLGMPLEGRHGDGFDWGYRFVSDNGTSFKAAGVNVPGGTVLTWWK